MVQTILFTIDAYNLYASGWGDPDKLLSLGMVWFSSTIMSGIADGVVQLFYAWRIFKLTQSRILVGGIALMIALGVTTAIYWGISTKVVSRDESYVRAPVSVLDISAICLFSDAICDTFISISMLYCLTRARKETVYRSTESMLTKLIRVTVGHGLLTASLVVLEAIMYLVFKDDYYYMCLGAITSKVYTVSLLSLLNSRMRMRNSNDSAYLWDSEEPPINHATQSIGITFAIMPTSTIAEIDDGASLTMFSSDRIDGIDRIASKSVGWQNDG